MAKWKVEMANGETIIIEAVSRWHVVQQMKEIGKVPILIERVGDTTPKEEVKWGTKFRREKGGVL